MSKERGELTMNKWILAIISAIAVVVVTTFGITLKSGTASAATLVNSDNRGSFICWKTTQKCMDLKDDTFSQGQPIYLWSSSGSDMGHGLGWNLDKLGTVSATTPFSYHPLDTKYAGDPYYYIEKTTATGHNGCIGDVSPDVTGELAWEPCGASTTRWVWSASNFLVNVDASDSQFNLAPMVASTCSTSDGSMIKAAILGNGCDGPWTVNTGTGT